MSINHANTIIIAVNISRQSYSKYNLYVPIRIVLILYFFFVEPRYLQVLQKKYFAPSTEVMILY